MTKSLHQGAYQLAKERINFLKKQTNPSVMILSYTVVVLWRRSKEAPRLGTEGAIGLGWPRETSIKKRLGRGRE